MRKNSLFYVKIRRKKKNKNEIAFLVDRETKVEVFNLKTGP
jgi:hypothetical protein